MGNNGYSRSTVVSSTQSDGISAIENCMPIAFQLRQLSLEAIILRLFDCTEKEGFVSCGTSELDRNHVTTASTESQEAILHGSSTAEDAGPILDVTADSSSSSHPASCPDLSVLSLR